MVYRPQDFHLEFSNFLNHLPKFPSFNYTYRGTSVDHFKPKFCCIPSLRCPTLDNGGMLARNDQWIFGHFCESEDHKPVFF